MREQLLLTMDAMDEIAKSPGRGQRTLDRRRLLR
jgi:hypothetical protein